VTTLAGTAGQRGNADGIGAEARFGYPEGIAADNIGHLYVADTSNHTIRTITPAGVVGTLAGAAGQPDSTGSSRSIQRRAVIETAPQSSRSRHIGHRRPLELTQHQSRRPVQVPQRDGSLRQLRFQQVEQVSKIPVDVVGSS
jgi:hypothetical protein